MEMKEIDKRATAILLAALDNEIDIKCMELKERQKEDKLKRLFFSGCVFILLFFVVQVLFKAFNFSLLVYFLIYQGLALLLLTPFMLNLNRGGVAK
jgi:hypothetical protein